MVVFVQLPAERLLEHFAAHVQSPSGIWVVSVVVSL